MSPIRAVARSATLAVALSGAAASATSITAPEVPTPQGEFRVTRGIAAPWLTASDAKPDTRAWLGATIEFDVARFAAPGQLGCANPRYETDRRPAAGLFQGGLPEPASEAAARLALTAPTTPSVSLTCDTGIFDLHWATPQALMLALDNVIWVLDRSPGAFAAAGTPEAQVQGLLETHFGGDMGFDSTTVAGKQRFLSAALQERIAAYFAAPFPTDEPPPINGDPFTDSQEYPVLFSVGSDSATGEIATVPVRYDDGYRAREVQFVLRRSADGWRVDDLRYEGDHTFRTQLEARP